MQPKQTTHQKYRVFHASPTYRRNSRIRSMILGVLAIVLLVLVIKDPYSGGLPAYFALPLIVGTLIQTTFQFLSTEKTRIVVSPEGIEFHSFGYSLVSAWHWVGEPELRQINWLGR